MRNLIKISLTAILAFVAGAQLCAQDEVPKFNPEEMAQQTSQFITKTMKEYESALKLTDWQIYRVDSLLNHDYNCKMEEFVSLSSRGVSASEWYQLASDKWDEIIYNGMQKVLTEEQWAKYVKMFAGREKRERDKRNAKRGIK